MTEGGTRPERLKKSKPEWLTNRIDLKSVSVEKLSHRGGEGGRKRGLLDAQSV